MKYYTEREIRKLLKYDYTTLQRLCKKLNIEPMLINKRLKLYTEEDFKKLQEIRPHVKAGKPPKKRGIT